MAGKSFGQKFKSILVFQILLKYTDKDHPLTASEIINRISIGLTGSEYIIQLENYDDIHYLIKNAYKGMNNIDKL